jgi:alkanesulfonate monooxygenase SsuD/methylene tetrahydromethanopterin reductase-like flavin-dependent oxidoreductase (luciferase family)
VDVGFASLTCQRYPGDPRTDADLYAEAIELAVEAERLGFSTVWLSEHHFFDDAYSPSCLVLAGAIAARTRTIRIGTGVLLAPLYEPVRLAEDAATADLISLGRLDLGLAIGWRAEEFEGLRTTLRGSRAFFEDTVAVCRQAWGDGLVTGGESVRYPGVSVTPKPFQPGGPPIWIGAMVEVSITRAGRIGDGYLASWPSVESFRRDCEWVRRGAEQAGRDPAGVKLGATVPTFPWLDGDPWPRIRDHFRYYTWKYEDMAKARGRLGPPPLPPPLDAAGEEKLRRMLVMGSPEEVAERMRAYEEAAGAPIHYAAELVWPGLDPGLRSEAVAILAEEVLPLLS